MYDWYDCPPAAWLSQLQTLRGMSLCDVPAAAIAAALPRLHTLHHVGPVDFRVAVFYDELLPRLRSFGLEGSWPETDGTEMADIPPLPLLEDFTWPAERVETSLPRRFMGARPSTLKICNVALAGWLKAVDDANSGSPTVTSPCGR
jgi:hypothetical protein